MTRNFASDRSNAQKCCLFDGLFQRGNCECCCSDCMIEVERTDPDGTPYFISKPVQCPEWLCFHLVPCYDGVACRCCGGQELEDCCRTLKGLVCCTCCHCESCERRVQDLRARNWCPSVRYFLRHKCFPGCLVRRWDAWDRSLQNIKSHIVYCSKTLVLACIFCCWNSIKFATSICSWIFFAFASICCLICSGFAMPCWFICTLLCYDSSSERYNCDSSCCNDCSSGCKGSGVAKIWRNIREKYFTCMKCPSLTCNATFNSGNCCSFYFNNLCDSLSCRSHATNPYIMSIDQNYLRLCGNNWCPKVVHGKSHTTCGIDVYGWHSYDIKGSPQYFCLECDGFRIRFHPKNLLFESIIKLVSVVYCLLYNVLAVGLAVTASTLECLWNLLVKVLSLFCCSCCIDKSVAKDELDFYCLHCERSVDKDDFKRYKECLWCRWKKPEKKQRDQSSTRSCLDMELKVVTRQPSGSKKSSRHSKTYVNISGPAKRNVKRIRSRSRKPSTHPYKVTIKHSGRYRRSNHKHIDSHTGIYENESIIDEQPHRVQSKISSMQKDYVYRNTDSVRNVDVSKASISGSRVYASSSSTSEDGSIQHVQIKTSDQLESDKSCTTPSQSDRWATRDRLPTPRRVTHQHGGKQLYQNQSSDSTSDSSDNDDEFSDEFDYYDDFSDDKIYSTAFSHRKTKQATNVKYQNTAPFVNFEHNVKKGDSTVPYVNAEHYVNKDENNAPYVNVEHHVNVPLGVSDVTGCDLGSASPVGQCSVAGDLVVEDLEHPSGHSVLDLHMPETSF